jgi:inosine/xanthosine triphosphatase
MKILVGSENPIKAAAVKAAFAQYFDDVEILAQAVNSQVSHQPVNDETFEGARNRALELSRINREQNLGARFCVGIEAGILQLYAKWFACSVICIMDDRDRMSLGTTTPYELPDSVTRQLLTGTELGDVIDRLVGDYNTKQKGGAIAFFTRGVLDRKKLYVQGVTSALIPFVNESLYF